MVYAALATGSGGLYLRLRPRLDDVELRTPLSILFCSIVTANATSAASRVASAVGRGDFAIVLTSVSLVAGALVIPPFIHMVCLFPRRIERRLSVPVIVLLYASFAAMVGAFVLGSGPTVAVRGENAPDIAFGGFWGSISGLQTVTLVPLMIWLSYLWARGSSVAERTAARGLWLAAGVPIILAFPFIFFGLTTNPPFDVITFSYAWWIVVVYVVVSAGKLEFRIIERAGPLQMGPRPRPPEGRWAGNPRRRNLLISGLSLVLFMGWLMVLNTVLIAPSDGFGRTVYNEGSIVAYSVALAYSAFRIGAREARVEHSAWSVLESLPLGLAVLTPEYKVEFANRALLEGLGYKTKDVRGRPAQDFLSEEVVREVRRDHARRSEGQATSYKLRIRTHSGDRHDAIVTLLPYMREGHYDGALAVINDVSEVVELRKEAEHHSSLASFLSDAVTHDLSNTMQVGLVRIQMALQMSAGDSGRMSRMLADAEASAQRSVRLIKEIKQIAIAERDEWPRERTPFAATLGDGIANARAAGSTPVSVEMAVPLQDVDVEANPLLSVAISKVVEEALETTPAGHGSVRVVARPCEGGVEVVVEGSTRKFDPKDFEALLRGTEGFQWGDTPWRCGVRVALAAAVLRAHGGSLHAGPGAGGQGTDFFLRLPSLNRPPTAEPIAFPLAAAPLRAVTAGPPLGGGGSQDS